MKRFLLLAITLLLSATAAPERDPPFDQSKHPPAPDYAQASAWSIRRGGNRLAPVDVFFVQPTTFVSGRWNQDVRDTATNRLTTLSVDLRQANAFAACCRLYSPRYRQASGRAFGEMAGDGGKAYALAYSDVRTAFRWYLAHRNHGRPFILAGHSQGALHALALLEKEIDGTRYAKLLVAAYLPGIGIPRSLFGDTLKVVPPCDTPERTGCVISWNGFVPAADVRNYVARSLSRHAGGPGDVLLCTNPLTFDDARPAAGPQENIGALLASTVDGTLPPLDADAAGAVCADGILRITPAVALNALPDGSLHLYDIPLFWANIRANAAVRIRAFLKEHGR